MSSFERLRISNTFSLARLLVAGLCATLALTVFFYPAFVFGVPMLDFATTLGTWLAGQAMPPLSEAWWQGVGEHLFNGTFAFPLLYSLFAYRVLPGRPLVKGALWGVALFLVQQYFFAPMRGLGLFSMYAPQPEIFALAALLSCVFYGMVFAIAAGPLEENGEINLIEEHPFSTPEAPRHAA